VSVIYINSYQFATPAGPTRLLDAYPGATAAYSLRQLRTGAINAIRVRRSSDNTEQDFTPAQITNGTLTAFCGAGNGLVRTWYDQSANNFHASQSDPAKQYLIVQNGSLITKNGKPSVLCDGIDDSMPTNSGIIAQPLTLAAVYSPNSINVNNHIVDGASVTARVVLGPIGSTNQYRLFAGSNARGGTVTTAQSLWFATANTTSSSLFINSSAVFTNQNIGANSLNNFVITGDPENQSNNADGYLQELVLYASNQSANRAGIEANINAHYSIF
jgi:hypothetical protein